MLTSVVGERGVAGLLQSVGEDVLVMERIWVYGNV